MFRLNSGGSERGTLSAVLSIVGAHRMALDSYLAVRGRPLDHQRTGYGHPAHR
jgi:hypothetical protein